MNGEEQLLPGEIQAAGKEPRHPTPEGEPRPVVGLDQQEAEQAIGEADRAVRLACRARARFYEPTWLEQAEDQLSKARDLRDAGKYEEARREAHQALHAAEQARSRSEAAAEARRMERLRRRNLVCIVILVGVVLLVAFLNWRARRWPPRVENPSVKENVTDPEKAETGNHEEPTPPLPEPANPAADEAAASTEPEPGPERPAKPTTQSLLMVRVTAENWLNVRRGPNLNHPIIGKVRRGTRLKALAKHGEWLQVELPDGRKGWVKQAYTKAW